VESHNIVQLCIATWSTVALSKVNVSRFLTVRSGQPPLQRAITTIFQKRAKGTECLYFLNSGRVTKAIIYMVHGLKLSTGLSHGAQTVNAHSSDTEYMIDVFPTGFIIFLNSLPPYLHVPQKMTERCACNATNFIHVRTRREY